MCALAVVVMCCAGATPASAGFPGSNGRMVWVERTTDLPIHLDLVTADADGGNAQQLTTGEFIEQAVVSPSGRVIAFWSLTSSGFAIKVIPIGGGNAVPLVTDATLDNLFLTWSPAGELFAVLSHTGDAANDFVKIDLPTGAMTPIGDLGSIVLFSPVADRVVSFNGTTVSVSDPNGANAVPVGSANTVPAWSPDGTRVALPSSSNLTVVNVDGTDPHPFAITDPGPLWWSPDGTTIVYTNGAIHPDGTAATRPTVPSPPPGYQTGEARFYDVAPLACDDPVVRRGIQWFVRHLCSAGVANEVFAFGNPFDVAVMGDWDHDLVATPGVFRDGTWFVSNEPDASGPVTQFHFGDPGDQPVVADYNHDGVDQISVYRNGVFYIPNSNAATTGFPVPMGDPGDIGIAGDWNGDGFETVGVFRGGTWFLSNSLSQAGVADTVLHFGQPGDIPVVGDWAGHGTTSIGVVRNGVWYLALTPHSGVADVTFAYGDPFDRPLVTRPG